MKPQDLYRASGTMALGTIFSRITGFIYGILIVAVLGTTLLADTYNVANTMPNILYNLLVGGALTAIFIPQLVRSFSDKDGGDGFASRLITTVCFILLVLVAIGMVFAPALVHLYAPEFSSPGFELEKSIAITFTRYCLPQIFFLGLFAMLGQAANARGSFAPLMWAPIANNLAGISLFTWFLLTTDNLSIGAITPTQIQIMGIGTSVSVAIQALILVPVVVRLGIKIRPKFGLHGLGKSFTLAGWTLVYVFISQLGYLVTVNVSTSAAVRSAKEGIVTGVGFTPFRNAYLIMLLPYSIITVSIITALLPHLSKLVIDKKPEEVREQLIRAIKLVGVVTVPSAIALFFFGPLITQVLFFGISGADSRFIGYVLSALSFGLIFFSINLILIRGFNAFEDTRTPVISILVINLISVGLSYVALFAMESHFVTVGLGAAFSVSYLVGLWVTLKLLARHTGRIRLQDFAGQHARIFLAAFLVMAPMFLLTNFLNLTSALALAIALFLVLILGFFGYLLTARWLGVQEVTMVRHIATSAMSRNKAR